MEAAAVKYPAIIVGAGPVGLSAALALRMHGLNPLVIEADPEERERPGSRALFIHNEPLAELERMHHGLAQSLLNEGMLWNARRYYYRGREFYKREYAQSPSMSFGTSLPQAVTERILRDACRAKEVKIRWGTQVKDVSTTPEEALVTLETGEQIYSTFVIGADGARSVVRKSLGLKFLGESTDSRWVIIDLDHVEGVNTPPDLSFHYLHPGVGGRNVLMVPFKGGWRLDIECKNDDETEYFSRRESISEWLPSVMDARYANHVRWISTYRFNQLCAEHFADNNRRALLIGEAAHLFPPFGGRGLNSGIIDAVSAANAVARSVESHAEQDRMAIVDAFDKDRREAAHFNIESAAIGVRLMTPPSIYRHLRREGLAFWARWSRQAASRLSIGPNGRAGGRPGAAGIY